jgi:rhomboid protease GluP
MSLEYREDLDQGGQEVAVPAVRPPVPLYTYALLAGILLAFAAQVYVGPNNEQAYTAAYDKPLFRNGSYWLILTGAAVHGGFLHLVMNGYALFSFGRLVEMLSNRAHVAIVFLLSVVGGGVLSLLYNPDGKSVGASGGIVGLISYLAVYAFKRRQFIAPEFRKNLLINIGFILIFGFVLFEIIDNSAHIGGLIAGAAYGLVQIPSDEYVDPRAAGTVTEVIGIACLGIYLAACIFSILITLNYS